MALAAMAVTILPATAAQACVLMEPVKTVPALAACAPMAHALTLIVQTEHVLMAPVQKVLVPMEPGLTAMVAPVVKWCALVCPSCHVTATANSAPAFPDSVMKKVALCAPACQPHPIARRIAQTAAPARTCAQIAQAFLTIPRQR